jgi:DNA-binding transcriptional LysR family regulator
MTVTGMTLRQMEVFYAIMRTGSATGAAALLNTTQPCISTVLRHCESQLRMKLFDRIAGRLHPTPDAEELLPGIEALFARVEVVNRLTRDLAAGRRGSLTIAAAFPIANGYLSKAVARFMAKRKDTSVVLQSMTSPEVLDRVVNREVELGIAFETLSSPAVDLELLLRANIACVLKPDHPLAARSEIDVRDLAEEPIITYQPGIPQRTLVDHAFIQANIVPHITTQVTISLTGIMMAQSGAGLALVEPIIVAGMEFSSVVARPLKPRVGMNAYLIRNRNAPRSMLTDMFIDDLKTMVQQDIPTMFGPLVTLPAAADRPRDERRPPTGEHLRGRRKSVSA